VRIRTTEADQDDGEGGVDEILSQLGFEFVDARDGQEYDQFDDDSDGQQRYSSLAAIC